jgi:hypothetical protein
LITIINCDPHPQLFVQQVVEALQKTLEELGVVDDDATVT